MRTASEPKEKVFSFRVTDKENALIRSMFGESKNVRKFIVKAIQDPEMRERIKEVRNGKQQ